MEMQTNSSLSRNNQSLAFVVTAIALLIITTYISQIIPESLTYYVAPAILAVITIYVLTIAYQYKKSQSRMLISHNTADLS